MPVYAGLNMKYNFHYAVSAASDSNLPEYRAETDWISLFDKDVFPTTFKHFQLGWQIGFGFDFRRFHIGMEGGTDFIPAYSMSSAKINSASFRMNFAYTFQINWKGSAKQPAAEM